MIESKRRALEEREREKKVKKGNGDLLTACVNHARELEVDVGLDLSEGRRRLDICGNDILSINNKLI